MSEKEEVVLGITITEEMVRQVNNGEYVCSTCWGPLSVRSDIKDGAERFQVYCTGRPMHECRGMVTREYAEARKAESSGELDEVKNNLAAAMGIEPKN